MSRKKAIVFIASVTSGILFIIFGSIGIITLKDILTKTSYIIAVKDRKTKIEKLEKEYKKIVQDIHILNNLHKEMHKDNARACSDAINRVASKKDYYYSEKDDY
jgi:cell division protein FtsB